MQINEKCFWSNCRLLATLIRAIESNVSNDLLCKKNFFPAVSQLDKLQYTESNYQQNFFVARKQMVSKQKTNQTRGRGMTGARSAAWVLKFLF